MNNIKKVIAALLCAAFLVPTFDVQAIEVSKQYISHNRSYRALYPVGVVIHDTDSEGGTAQNNHDYFNRVQVYASAHYFVDWNKAINTIPESEQAWHAGPSANRRYLSIEICMPRGYNPLLFTAAYNNAVELTADMCKRYGWDTSKIYSHYWVSMTYKETDHEDPIAYFQQYGKSMDIFRSDVAKKINGKYSGTNVTSNKDKNDTTNSAGTKLTGENAQAVGDWFYVRNQYGTIQTGHRVDNYDNMVVHDVSYSKQLVEVTYPTSSGSRSGYIKNCSFIHYKYTGAWKNGSTKELVYDKKNGYVIGSINSWENATVLEKKDGWTNVVYDTSKGHNTKSGWVRYSGR